VGRKTAIASAIQIIIITAMSGRFTSGPPGKNGVDLLAGQFLSAIMFLVISRGDEG
jgi:hypothetical protein